METNKAKFVSGEKYQGQISWSDNMLVGNAQIDTNHREFILLTNELMTSCEKSALARIHEMEKHLISHFDSEELLMEKTEFPGTECHIDEHGKVFDAVALVKERYSAGTATLSDVKRLGQALIDWFPGHIFYMDSALSNWVSKKTHNGSPIVLRRDALQVSN